MSGTVCCYAGCKRSYSTDKETSFFRFPENPKRRKKWMENSGNLELESLPERQLRGKRICSDHFTSKSFQTKTTLVDSAVPVIAKITPTTVVASINKPSTRRQSPAKPSSSASAQQAASPAVQKTPEKSAMADKEKKEEVVIAKKSTPGRKTKEKSVPVSKKGESSKPNSQNIEASEKVSDSGSKDLESLPERQLRGKRICTDPLTPKSSQTKTTIVDSAVPVPAKTPTTVVATKNKPSTRSQSPAKPSSPASAQKAASQAEQKSQEKSVVDDKEKEEEVVTAKKSTPGTARRTKEKPVPVSKKSDSSKPNSLNMEVSEKVAVGDSSGSKVPSLVSVQNAATASATVQKSPEKSAMADKEKKEEVVTAKKSTPGTAKRTKEKPLPVPKKSEPIKSVSQKIETREKVSDSGSKEKDLESSPERPESQLLLLGKIICSGSDHFTPKSQIKTALAESAIPVTAKITPTATVVATTNKQSKGKQSPAKNSLSASAQQATSPAVQKSSEKSAKADKEKKEEVVTAKKSTPGTARRTKEKSLPVPKASEPIKPVVQKIEASGNVSDSGSYDEYVYFDRDFEETIFEEDPDGRLDREFERFYASLKRFLHLSGKWTMGGVQWDPQGRRKVIVISEPEIPPNGKPCVKRCLQFFEDKAIRVFIDGMDMTDVFGMTCYAEKEDVASLICRVAEASSCCGVPEMVTDDLAFFPTVRKRNTSYFDSNCPGVIPNDSDDPMCSACKYLQDLVMENRSNEQHRLLERRIKSQEKQFQHPFGEALYTMFNDLVDETDPTKPKKKRVKETFFRKYLHDTRFKFEGDGARTERVYIEKPISVDSVSASFQDIVSKLGFNVPNAKRQKSAGGLAQKSLGASSTAGSKPTRVYPGSSGVSRTQSKLPLQVEHILPFPASSSFTLDDGQEYELIGEVDSFGQEIVEMKPTPSQQFEIIEVDDETLAKLASSKNPVVVLPEAAATPPNLQVTRIDANDPNLSQILKAINTSHGYK